MIGDVAQMCPFNVIELDQLVQLLGATFQMCSSLQHIFAGMISKKKSHPCMDLLLKYISN